MGYTIAWLLGIAGSHAGFFGLFSAMCSKQGQSFELIQNLEQSARRIA
jgi:hypothetical protein